MSDALSEAADEPMEALPSPFLESSHLELRARIRSHLRPELLAVQDACDRGELGEDAAALRLVHTLARGGALQSMLGGDARTLCVAREEVAAISAFADNQLALQGLGSQPIAEFGSAQLQAEYLRAARDGTKVAAFALTEEAAGSDVRAVRTTARRDGTHWILDGEKTLITNAGVADFYTVFARRAGDSGDEPHFEAFVVDADAPGVEVAERFQVMAPHPIGRVRFTSCRVAEEHRLGDEGAGMAAALSTLERFRPSVGAAAAGLASRALSAARAHVRRRVQFGRTLDRFQLVRAQLAEMWVDLESARLAVYRAAWCFDQGDRGAPGARSIRQAVSSMAKWTATEAAFRVVDRAVQLFGGRGVLRGEICERLFREVRALRIYEGTSEIQSLILARELLGDDR